MLLYLPYQGGFETGYKEREEDREPWNAIIVLRLEPFNETLISKGQPCRPSALGAYSRRTDLSASKPYKLVHRVHYEYNVNSTDGVLTCTVSMHGCRTSSGAYCTMKQRSIQWIYIIVLQGTELFVCANNVNKKTTIIVQEYGQQNNNKKE